MSPFLDSTLGSFYTLPKIHKVDLDNVTPSAIPGRPIVSNIKTPTENISQFLDSHLKHIPQQLKSFVKDTPDFLRKIEALNETNIFGSDTLLVTLDVTSLYTNIPKADGLAAIEQLCYTDQHKPEISKEVALTLLDLVLTLNAFEFNGKIYQQIHGTSMGTPVAPTYSNIFMGLLEAQILNSFAEKPLIYLRYLDDIFIVWTHGRDKLNAFIQHANNCHPTIQFTATVSDTSISFLDTKITLNNNKLHTTLFKKPTDKHQFLHFESHHPRHCKNAIPFSQIVRLRRLCMNDTDYNQKVDELVETLKNQHYPDNVLHQVKQKSLTLDRQTVLRNSQKNKINGTNFVTSFSTKLNNCNQIFRKHFHLIRSDPKLSTIFKAPPKVVYRRNRNLKSMLTNNRLNSNNNSGCRPCNSTRCLTCQHMQSASQIQTQNGNFTWKIKKSFNCKSANVIYCIQCALCQKQYFGETQQEFQKRMTSHRYDIIHSVDTAISEHFNSDNHRLEHMQVYIIDGGFSKHRQRKYKESFFIAKFRSLIPNGINRSSGWLNSVQCGHT